MRHDPDAVMLFAAGFGKRMGALTATLPKPLIPVAGRALIDHALALVDDLGVARKVVNLHYLAPQLAAHLSPRADIDLSVETPDILETGGGLRLALPLLGPGPVYTLNTDAVWTGPNPLKTLCDAWRPDQMDALLLVIPTAIALGHPGSGDFALDPQGRITRGSGYTYVGAQILKTTGLSAIPDTVFSLNILWNQMIHARRAYGVIHPGGWCDVGSPQGIALAETMLATHV